MNIIEPAGKLGILHVLRPVRNVFQKLSCTEQRRERVAAYLWFQLSAGAPALWSFWKYLHLLLAFS